MEVIIKDGIRKLIECIVYTPKGKGGGGINKQNSKILLKNWCNNVILLLLLIEPISIGLIFKVSNKSRIIWQNSR